MAHSGYISEATLRSLTEGSYEQAIVLVAEAIAPARLLATYPDRIVYLSEDGVFYQATYKVEGGKAVLSEEQKVPVPTVTEQVSEEEEAVSAQLAYLFAPRLWRSVYEAKQDTILKVVGEESTSKDLPSFAYVAENSVPSKISGAFVRRGLGVLTQRIDALSIKVRDSIKGLPPGVSESGILEQSFAAFSEDLLTDLNAVGRAARGIAEHVQSPRILARFHDALLDAWPTYHMAGEFVGAIARKMCVEA